ncbi:MAG: hypothetical protein AAGE59_37925 [Cyanobacteria bacterium P01_F01_bin.86]
MTSFEKVKIGPLLAPPDERSREDRLQILAAWQTSGAAQQQDLLMPNFSRREA